MTKPNFLFGALTFLAVFSLVSCSKDDNNDSKNTYTHGVIITNEGNFMDNNGSVSYIPLTEDTICNDLFEEVNGRSLGDVIMSFAACKNKGYIVANNSNKVEIIDLKTFQSVGVVEVSLPRYVACTSDGKVYVSFSSYPGKVLSVNYDDNTVLDTVTVGNQPEHMLVDDNMLLVANGKWGYDSTVSVIDTRTDKVVQTINVGDGATDLTQDGTGAIWVLCQGKVVYNDDWTAIVSETDSKIVRLQAGTYTPDKTIVVGHTGDGFNPSSIASDPDGQTIYVAEKEGVYAVSVDATEMPAQPLITGDFNGLGVNPSNGRIYALEINGYLSSGIVHIFTAQGSEVRSMTTGIAPNGAFFY